MIRKLVGDDICPLCKKEYWDCHHTWKDFAEEVIKLQSLILNINIPCVMESVNTVWGADIEYNYICPFCGAKAHTLDNLLYCHDKDCIFDSLSG